MKKLMYVSGPSGIAKTKVTEKLENLAGPLGIRFERVIATTSREMRPGESQGKPWYFRSVREIIAENKNDPERYLRVEIRQGEFQGLDADRELKNKLEKACVLWCELHAKWFMEIKKWLEIHMPETAIVKVFVAPFTETELLTLARDGKITDSKIIEEEMRRRLIARRAANLDNATDAQIQVRAHDAAEQYANRNAYDCIIVNHQGEESPEWGGAKEFPAGEAARVLAQFLHIYLA